MKWLGAHVSASGGLNEAPGRGVGIGADAIQIFSKNQLQWKAKDLTESEGDGFRRAWKDSGLRAAMVHGSYLINLASPDDEKLQKSRDAFLDEILRADALGIDRLVFHPGAHMGAGEEKGLQRVADSLNWAIEASPRSRVRLVLETTAGQGSTLGSRFEHIARIAQGVKKKKRLGVCVDSCHIFAAGYDLREPATYERTMKELDSAIGLKWVCGFHLNDSKADLGSRLDRHANIGKGKIGKKAFERLMRDDRFDDMPMTLETPGGPVAWKEEIAMLRKWAEGNDPEESR